MRLFLAFLMCVAFASHSANARMFANEEMMNPDGYPALVHFQAGSRGKPLIVLVAGSGNTGRIFYGPHAGANPDQFLASHLNALGYNVVSISTPIATQDPIFQNAYPDFSIRAWGKTLALVAGEIVARHDLSPNVLLAGWSMGGKAAQSMASQAEAAGIQVDLFISLSATPPVLGVLPIETTFPMNPDTGYGAAPDPAYKGFLWNIRVNARREGLDDIIPAEDLIAHYVGEGPVGLTHTGLRYRDGAIVPDRDADVTDGQGFDFAGYPLTATVIPRGRHDLRHSVTDRHTWGMITTNHLYQNVLKPNLKNMQHVPTEEITRIADMISTAPERLSRTVWGNHFFFVGESGARSTAEAISWLDAEARSLQSDLSAAFRSIGSSAHAEAQN